MWLGIVIIAGSLAVFVGMFSVLSADIQRASDAITNNRATIAKEGALINSYSGLKANAANAAVYQSAMDKLLGSQDNLIVFPSQIDNLARKEGVDGSFTFVGNPVPAGPDTVGYSDFTLNVTGQLADITGFMDDMESSAPILLSKIDSFDLTQSGQSYALTAEGRVFFK